MKEGIPKLAMDVIIAAIAMKIVMSPYSASVKLPCRVKKYVLIRPTAKPM